MKKLTFSILAMLWLLAANAQTVIIKPQTGLSSVPSLTIQKIELLDKATAITFHLSKECGGGFSIPQKTYIQEVGQTEKLFVKSAIGIELKKGQPKPGADGREYTLYFPAIKTTTTKLDYGEANEGGDWFIYDIALKPYESIMPQALQGNWHHIQTGSYTIGLFDTVAVYNMQVLNYKSVNVKNGKGSIVLSQQNKTIELFVQQSDNGVMLMGESEKNLTAYTQNVSKIKVSNIDGNQPFEAPVFKHDTAIYCGFIKNYTPRAGFKTATIHVDNLFTGNQATHTIIIADNGAFSIKIPICHPVEAYIRSPFLGRTIYLEPGNTTFQVVDLNKDFGRLYMGHNAKLNTDLQKLKDIRSYDYNEMQKKILDMNLVQYKEFCTKGYHDALDELEKENKAQSLCAKALQIKKLDLQYDYYSTLMSYDMKYGSAYRQKNKIPNSQRQLDITIEQPTAEYYDFLNNEVANNHLATLSTEYKSFINRLKYLDFIRADRKNYMMVDIMNGLINNGIKLSDIELECFQALMEFEKPEVKVLIDNNRSNLMSLQQKYAEQFKAFATEPKEFYQFKEYLISNKVALTADDIQKFDAIKSFTDSEVNKAYNSTLAKYATVQKEFLVKYQKDINEFFRLKPNTETIVKLDELFGIKKGLATDIMYSEDVCRFILEELSPISDERLKQVQAQFTTPFIAQNVEVCNNDAKAKIEANKFKTGFNINETPKTEADLLFAEIMKKYQGKVVFVDFWATWCSPCRSNIAEMKPLKEKLANENVVFVYITNESSPKGTYDNLIPDIKGEHYRLSTDEWNYLSGKFNISGIPHTMLVDKQGVVVNPKLTRDLVSLEKVIADELKK